MAGITARAVVFIVVMLMTAVLVKGVRRWTERRRILDHPNERSSHTVPTPRGGGIAIVVVTLIAFAVLQRHEMFRRPAFTIIVLLGAFIAAVSWLDDIRSLPIALRLAIHIAAATATVAVVGGWTNVWVPIIGEIALGTAGTIITILWIAGLTNAYNFMDGIDGIAGLQAVVAGLGWVVLGSMTGIPEAATIGLLLAGTSLGFLLENWQPARIFMGDVGSAFLGYMFAALTVAASAIDRRLAVGGALLVWPFVFDAAFTFIRRARRGERVFSAHRSHLYQRLQQTGLSHASTSLIYGGLALLGLLSALAVIREAAVAPVVLLAVLTAALALVVMVRVRQTPA